MHRLARPAWAFVALLFLVGVSAFLRTRALDTSLWIDEGISTGIASHPAAEIPGLLRQDGSPPAYYLLLHAWSELAGTGETALRVPSLVFALLTIPAALWAGSSIFGRTAGWISAATAAVLPFLTTYAQEARMYALIALLSVLGTAFFVQGFAFRARRYVPAFALLLTALLYTHYWGLFFAFGGLAALGSLVIAAAPEERRQLVLDGIFAFGFAAVAFSLWVPTLAFQLEHTGAPWSNPPPVGALVGIAALAAATLAVPRVGPSPREAGVLQALCLLAAVGLAAAWASAMVEPGWAARYLAVLVGPLLLLAGAGLSRLGPLGILAAAAISCAWMLDLSPIEKSNVAGASSLAAASLQPGDLVVSTQPEQVPVLAHYLSDDLRFATPLGPVADPAVMDWRDALARLRTTRPEVTLAPLLDSLPSGARVLLVVPETGDGRWRAPWTRLVALRSDEWMLALGADPRFRLVQSAAPESPTERTSVHLALYAKTASVSDGL